MTLSKELVLFLKIVDIIAFATLATVCVNQVNISGMIPNYCGFQVIIITLVF